MHDPLVADDLWKRRGISLLWDADSLNGLCDSDQVISLRQFRGLHADGWNDVDDFLVDEVTLVVAGLESSIDSLAPEQATEWLKENLYKELVDFQREVAGGGTSASLVFWFVDPKRLDFKPTESEWFYHCAGEHKNEQIPLGQCLFNGAQRDLKKIQDRDGKNLGLYHPRIS